MIEATTAELIEELESRGYITDLLFCTNDVKMELDRVNKDREEDGKPPIEMSDEDKDYLLSSIHTDWFISRFNDRISEKVAEFIDDESEDSDED